MNCRKLTNGNTIHKEDSITDCNQITTMTTDEQRETAEVLNMLGQITETGGANDELPMETSDLDRILEGAGLENSTPTCLGETVSTTTTTTTSKASKIEEGIKFVQNIHKQLESEFASTNDNNSKETFQCDKCMRLFNRKIQLIAHNRYHVLKDQGKLKNIVAKKTLRNKWKTLWAVNYRMFSSPTFMRALISRLRAVKKVKKSFKKKQFQKVYRVDNFPCVFCDGKIFSCFDELFVHMQRHMKSFKCPFCAIPLQRHTLIQHLEDHYTSKDVVVRLGSRIEKDGRKRADGYTYFSDDIASSQNRNKSGGKRGRPPKSNMSNIGRVDSDTRAPLASKRKQMGDYGRSDFVYFDDEDEEEAINAEESEDEYTPDKEEVNEAENEEDNEEEDEEEDKTDKKPVNQETTNKIQATGVASTDMKEGKILHTPQGTFKVVKVIPQAGGGQRVLVVPYDEDKEKEQNKTPNSTVSTPQSSNSISSRGRSAASVSVRGRGRGGLVKGRGRDPEDPDWTEPDTPKGRSAPIRGYTPRGRPRGRPPKAGNYSPRIEPKYSLLDDGTKVRELTEEESGQTIIQQVKEGESVSLKLPNGQVVSLKPNKKYNISYKKTQNETISYVINTPSNMTGYPGAGQKTSDSIVTENQQDSANDEANNVIADNTSGVVNTNDQVEEMEQTNNADNQLPENLFEKEETRETVGGDEALTNSENDIPPAPEGQDYLLVPQNLLPQIMGEGQAEEQGFDANSDEYVQILVESSMVQTLLDMSPLIMRASDNVTRNEPEAVPAPQPVSNSPPMQSLLKTPQTQAMMRQAKQRQQQQQSGGGQPLVIKSSAKPGTKQQVMLTGNNGQQIVVEGIVNEQQEIVIDTSILALMT